MAVDNITSNGILFLSCIFANEKMKWHGLIRFLFRNLAMRLLIRNCYAHVWKTPKVRVGVATWQLGLRKPLIWRWILSHVLSIHGLVLRMNCSFGTRYKVIKKGPSREMSVSLGTYVQPAFNLNAAVPCYVGWVLNLGRKQCQCIANSLKELWRLARGYNN